MTNTTKNIFTEQDEKLKSGERLKQARIDRGFTMEQLAKKVSYSKSTIAKWEREGIPNLETLKKLSDALSCDLNHEVYDQDCPIREVGLEILISLVKEGGYIYFYKLLELYLYGMDEERASKEIVELCRSGCVIREEFIDYDTISKDTVFLTAKGLITCKHKLTNPIIEAELKAYFPEVSVYEKLLKGDRDHNRVSSYQEYVSSRPLEKMVRNLEISERRTDFIIYLKRHFQSGLESDNFGIVHAPLKYPGSSCLSLFPGENLHNDILHWMIGNVNRRNLNYLVRSQVDPILVSWGYDDGWMIPGETDGCKTITITDSYDGSSNVYSVPNLRKEDYWETIASNPNPWDEYCKYMEEQERIEDEIEKHPERCVSLFGTPYYYYEKAGVISKGKPKKYIVEELLESESYRNRLLDHYRIAVEKKTTEKKTRNMELWFSKDEIIDFVKENIKPAANDEEREIDKVLQEITTKFPETLSYYGLPREWEEWGIGDYIRSCYEIGSSKTKKNNKNKGNKNAR